VTDIDRWMDEHDSDLDALAKALDADSDAVRYLASLVLAGENDHGIYERLHELVPSLDGQESPLAGIPELLFEVRRLVAAS
jgi:hypothetical protein